jgi:hypothetical protein
MKSKAGGSHFDYNGTGGLPIHESEAALHDARRSSPNLMSATPSKSIPLIDDDLIAGSLRQVLLSARCAVAVDSATARAMMAERGYDTVMVDPYLTGGVHKDGCDLINSILMQQPGAGT